MRINKYLSRCGVSSRRGAEKLVKAGQVTINDRTADLGAVIDEQIDVVKVRGSLVVPVQNKLYVLLNKPKLVMTTLHDPFKRRTVAHLLKDVPERVYPVGRLDYGTEGVLLLTNDGDLAYRLSHPRYQVERKYQATVEGRFTSSAAERITEGVRLEDGSIGRAQVEFIRQGEQSSVIRLVLTEGRKREVRQLCRAVGHPVKRLVRLEFAQMTCEGLKRGRWRYLYPAEVSNLKRLVGLA